MLNDEICKLRDKLNKSIEEGEDYSIIYKLSIELDELIASYYTKDGKKKAVMLIIWVNDFLNRKKVGGFFYCIGKIGFYLDPMWIFPYTTRLGILYSWSTAKQSSHVCVEIFDFVNARLSY